MTIALRPLRPVRPLLRKDAQLGLFGDVTPVKLTPKAKARAKLYGNVAAPVVPKPKAAPKPTATPGKKPKEGDTRTNRAGNKEVLRGGRWRLADNPQVIAKDKLAAIVPVVEDLREADLVDEALPDVPMADPEITLEDLQEPGEEAMGEAGEMAGEEKLIAPKTSSSYWHGISRDALTGAGIEEVFKRATGLDADEKHIKLLLSTAAKDGTSLWELPDDSVSSSKNKGIGMRHFELKGFVAFDRPSQRFFITSKGIKAVKDYYKEKSKLLGTDSYADNDPVDDIDPLSRIKAKREIDEIERIKADEQAKARLAEGPKVPDLDVFGKRVANSIRQKLDDYGMAEGDLPIDLWQAIEYAKHDRGLSWPRAVDWAMSRRAKPTPEPTPEPMLEEAGEMAGEVPELKPKGRGKSSKPDGEGSDRPGPRRAKAGGEYGPNNEWYEGGKFIPSEDKPKVLGSKKAKPKEEGEEQSPAKKAKVEKRSPRPVPVGPDEMAVLPKGKSSIYLYLSGRYIKPVGDDGIMQIKDPDVLNAQLEMDYQQAKSRGSLVANHGMISELVRRWNDGERFYDSEELRSMMDSPRKGERSEVPGAIAGGGGDGSESAGDGVSGRSGGFSGKDRLPDMEPAKVEVGTYSPILRYPPREQKGGRQWVDMAKQHTPEDWRRIGDFFEGKLKNLGSEEIPMTMGEFQSDFSNEDIKDHLNLVQGTITARKVQKYPDFARAMNLMELYAGLHPQMKFIIWPKPESRYAAYPDDSPSAKPKTENDQHMRRLLRLMNEALDTPGRERVTLPDRTVQRRSPAPSLQAPPGFRVNKFGGVASDGTQIAAGEGYIRNEDGRWKIYSKDQVDSDGNILTKSLRPYPGPYLTLLGVRYILDRGILRKAGMSWEDFRCEAEAMHKEAQGDDDPCWKGYEAVGLKRKGKRMVPNCVPVSR